MRYGIFEFFFENDKPVFRWAGRDMSLSSARDAVKAWNYQASLKGGWMETIVDDDSAFEQRKCETLAYHPRFQAGYKPWNK